MSAHPCNLQADREYGGALMRVTLAEAEALLVLCAADAGGMAAALAHIADVDPPSAGVALTQVLKCYTPVLPISFRCVTREAAQSLHISMVSYECPCCTAVPGQCATLLGSPLLAAGQRCA